MLLPSQWNSYLNNIPKEGWFQVLIQKVEEAYQNIQVFPPQDLVFNAFNLCEPKQVKVVILGQDPYHKEGQAHGLSFSVPDGVTTPPSLKNIFKELHNDTGVMKESSNLSPWAQQGVLLLNSVLTVEEARPGSNKDFGWEKFTDTVIQTISEKNENVVFILWGTYAQKKKALIDSDKHLVLTSVHPSPLSAHRGFFGNKHFSKTNKYLKKHKKEEIKW